MSKPLAFLVVSLVLATACSYPSKAHHADVDAGAGSAACTPGAAACTAGALSTCEAGGDVVETPCALGCSADATHCLAPVPSNGLAAAAALIPSPGDLAFASGVLDVDTSMFTLDAGGSAVAVPSVEVAAADGGAPIRVFVGGAIRITGVLTVVSSLSPQGFGAAAAFVATGELDISGGLRAFSGGVDVAGCTGATGAIGGGGTSGGGGGGFATAGGSGGALLFEGMPDVAATAAGSASVDAALVPLRGGCPGGAANSLNQGGAPGGAVQLFSPVRVDVEGEIIVDGSIAPIGAGGGAGGGVLIEAPSVTLGAAAVVSARGGGGASGDTSPTGFNAFGTPLLGAACSSNGCGAGGDGADVAGAVGQPGGTASVGPLGAGVPPEARSAGGGGGGAGTIRVNTADGTLSESSAIVSGALSLGAVATE